MGLGARSCALAAYPPCLGGGGAQGSARREHSCAGCGLRAWGTSAWRAVLLLGQRVVSARVQSAAAAKCSALSLSRCAECEMQVACRLGPHPGRGLAHCPAPSVQRAGQKRVPKLRLATLSMATTAEGLTQRRTAATQRSSEEIQPGEPGATQPAIAAACSTPPPAAARRHPPPLAVPSLPNTAVDDNSPQAQPPVAQAARPARRSAGAQKSCLPLIVCRAAANAGANHHLAPLSSSSSSQTALAWRSQTALAWRWPRRCWCSQAWRRQRWRGTGRQRCRPVPCRCALGRSIAPRPAAAACPTPAQALLSSLPPALPPCPAARQPGDGGRPAVHPRGASAVHGALGAPRLPGSRRLRLRRDSRPRVL